MKKEKTKKRRNTRRLTYSWKSHIKSDIEDGDCESCLLWKLNTANPQNISQEDTGVRMTLKSNSVDYLELGFLYSNLIRKRIRIAL
jgi:hypothetical protein